MPTKANNGPIEYESYQPEIDEYNTALDNLNKKTDENGNVSYGYTDTTPKPTDEGLGKKPTFADNYQDMIGNQLNSILNREKFSYNPAGDQMYQMYADKYKREGKAAMQDTMGAAAGLTGGYGNSYAATAGSQAYNQSLERMNDMLPQLQQAAYQRYQDETANQYNQMGLLENLSSTDWDRYRDNMSDYWTNYGNLWDQYYNDRNYGLNQWNATNNYLTGRLGYWTDNDNASYNRGYNLLNAQQ